MWDIKGKKLGVPIWQLLGGNVRDKVKVYGWIGGDTPQDVYEGALERSDQGFTVVKMNGTGMAHRVRVVRFSSSRSQDLSIGWILPLCLVMQ